MIVFEIQDIIHSDCYVVTVEGKTELRQFRIQFVKQMFFRKPGVP